MSESITAAVSFIAGGAGDGWAANLRDDPKMRLLAACIVHQQDAGFGAAADLRQATCPECGAPGFNTGWGYFAYECGAEILTDDEATSSSPCGRLARAALAKAESSASRSE